MSYSSLDPDEKVIIVIRKHWLTIFVPCFILCLFILAPLFLYPFFGSLLFSSLTTNSAYLLVYAYSLYIAVGWIFGFVLWTDYYLDMWIVTDKRIIDVEQNGLFSRDTASLRLENIQDVKIEVVGLLNTVLGIGTVKIQTAGQEEHFIITYAASPEHVKNTIMEAYNKVQEEIKTVRLADTTNL